MTDKPETPAAHPSPSYFHGDGAPFIYFDASSCHGTIHGAVQIELVSRVLVPNPDGSVDMKFCPTGHLRCGPAAIKSLREAIDSALKMLERPHEQAPIASSKLN